MPTDKTKPKKSNPNIDDNTVYLLDLFGVSNDEKNIKPSYQYSINEDEYNGES